MNADIMSDIFSSQKKPKRIEYPFAWVGHFPFAFYLVHISRPEIIVELGTHSGNSFAAFSQAVKENDIKAKCYAVDTWEGDEQAGQYGNEIYEELYEYISNNYKQQSILIRSRFDEALDDFIDGTVDILHIDGLHTYEAVKHDYETWLPKISDRGVILFHDICVRERGFGVYRLWGELIKDWPSFDFSHSHGLGILCVGKNMPEKLMTFIDYANKNKEHIQKTFEALSLINSNDEALLYQCDDIIGKIGAHIYSELYVDCGEGFTESSKVLGNVIQHSNGRYNIEFELKRFPATSRVRFDPSHEPVKLRGVACRIEYKSGHSGDIIYSDTNAVVNEKSDYVFAYDPYYIYELKESPVKISFKFELIDEGSECVNEYISVLRRQQGCEDANSRVYELQQSNKWLNSELDKHKAAIRDLDRKGYNEESRRKWAESEGDKFKADIVVLGEKILALENKITWYEAELEKHKNVISERDVECVLLQGEIDKKSATIESLIKRLNYIQSHWSYIVFRWLIK